jgi:CDP-diacylglycerol--serine O-phosphatidyltransferase
MRTFSLTSLNRSPAAFFHPSNLVSYLSAAAGMAAAILAHESGSRQAIGSLLGLCALADMFDGRFASLFKRTEMQKKFGIQLDSLVDVVVFGLVPVVCLHALILFESGEQRVFWWLCAFFYLLCALTRLGFYNIKAEEEPGFVGMPTTLTGLIWANALLFKPQAPWTALVLLLCGVAMVAPVRFPRPRGRGFVILGIWAAAVMLFQAFWQQEPKLLDFLGIQ